MPSLTATAPTKSKVNRRAKPERYIPEGYAPGVVEQGLFYRDLMCLIAHDFATRAWRPNIYSGLAKFGVTSVSRPSWDCFNFYCAHLSTPSTQVAFIEDLRTTCTSPASNAAYADLHHAFALQDDVLAAAITRLTKVSAPEPNDEPVPFVFTETGPAPLQYQPSLFDD